MPIVGHAAAQAAFAAALRSGALHHAWLLAGPEGVGKATFARQAGLSLLGDHPQHAALIAARSHPDFQLIEREVWDKASPPRIVPYDQREEGAVPASTIRVAQIRALHEVLAKAAGLADRRAIIIDSADALDRNAANALLKSLEEPPANTVFLLVSHALGRLLPTIRSRCRILRFGALDETDMRRVLRSELPEAGESEIAAAARAGEGSPGRALRFAGLDVAGLDAAIARLLRSGDPDNAERVRLAQALSGKAAQPRYETFLDRAPAAIAAEARGRTGPALRLALDAHHDARELAGSALGLSLDPQATVFEMGGVLARLSSPA